MININVIQCVTLYNTIILIHNKLNTNENNDNDNKNNNNWLLRVAQSAGP